MKDTRIDFVKKLVNKSTIEVKPLIEIGDSGISLYTNAEVYMGKYYELSFLDPLITHIDENISFLNYKKFYSISVERYANFGTFNQSGVISHPTNIEYCARYIKIFEALLEIKYKPAQVLAMLD